MYLRERSPALVASRLGLGLKVRGTNDLGSLLSGLAETARIPFEAVS